MANDSSSFFALQAEAVAMAAETPHRTLHVGGDDQIE